MFDDDTPSILDLLRETTDTTTTTLASARAQFQAALEVGKTTCPCCLRYAKIQTRPFTDRMARFLIRLVRAWTTSPRPYRVREIQERSGEKGSTDASYLVGWGLIRRDARDQYEPTNEGVAFVRGEVSVLSHARTYDRRCRGLTGEPITIADALGEPFDLDALRAT